MRYLKFILPLVAVVLLDMLFQFGAWEPLASPESHAGMSITKKRALGDPAFSHIDYVTLGSSRPVYGIDHQVMQRALSERGRMYANASVPGMHWMSLGVITHWLRDHHPEIRGGLIALSVQDMLAPGNGAYEIGIAYPFRRLDDIGPMTQHTAFDWHDPATYGLYSGLFEYHEDVQDLFKAPLHRRSLLKYFRALPAQQILAGNADETKNLCSAGITVLNDCATLFTRPHDAALDAQCTMVSGSAAARQDFRAYVSGRQPLPPFLQRTHDLIQAQLREIDWPERPVVVLMPMHRIWLDDVMPIDAHAWALSILQPLADAGDIRLIDTTDFFDDTEHHTDCSAFFDLYHNNVAGRDRLMPFLLPQLLPP